MSPIKMNINTAKGNLIDKLQFKSETFQYLVKVNNCYVLSAIWSLQFGSAPEIFSEYLKSLDNICVNIEKTKHNKDILLKEKVKGLYSDNCVQDIGYFELSKKDSGKWRNTTDFFGEIKSFCWLKNNDFKNIKLVKKQKYKTPDFSAESGSKFFYIETKCINMSRKVEDYLRKKRSDGMSGGKDYEALINKIKLVIKDADEKFNATDAKSRLLLLNYHWSPENAGSKKTLKEIFGEEYLNSLGKNSFIQIEEIPNY